MDGPKLPSSPGDCRFRLGRQQHGHRRHPRGRPNASYQPSFALTHLSTSAHAGSADLMRSTGNARSTGASQPKRLLELSGVRSQNRMTLHLPRVGPERHSVETRNYVEVEVKDNLTASRLVELLNRDSIGAKCVS